MSLFTKLFGGDKEAEKAAKDLLEGLFGNQSKPAAQPSEPKPQQNAAPSRDPEPAAEPTGPSGFSWGEVMPNEPNQYNYGGAFWQYFEEIFREDFPAYRIDKQVPQELKRFVYTFYDGGRKALVVELLDRSSEAKAVRAKCGREGIPYLRFYYNYDGWWNTRAYVRTRVSKALNG